MPDNRAEMYRNQSLKRVSPILYAVCSYSDEINVIIWVCNLIINLFILFNYSYRNEYLVIPPPVIQDPLEWAYESLRLKGPDISVIEIVDPAVIAKQIKLKYPSMAIIIDYLAVFNAFLAILAFAMQQVKIYGMRPVEKKKNSSGETWTKGTLASFIPYFPEPA
jgi:hypothetical protein